MGTLDIENMRTHVKDEPVATPNPIIKQTGEGMKQERTAADNLNSLKNAFQSVTKVLTAIPTAPNLYLRGVVNPFLRRLDDGIHADANMAEKMRDDLGLDNTIGNVIATTVAANVKGDINRVKQYSRGEFNMITALNTKKYGIDPETGEYKSREEIAKQSEEQQSVQEQPNYQTQVLGKDRGKTVTNDLAAIGVNVPGIAAGGNAGIQLG